MGTTKRSVLVIVAILFLVSIAIAQEKEVKVAPPGPTTTHQAKLPITVKGAEYDLVSTILDFPPGIGVPTHFHGGHVVATLLSGEMTLKEKGTERIVKPGGSWTENPGDEHAVVNAGAVTARVAVTMLLPKGAAATTVVK